ncbi:MAG: DUF4864 domain-containing protein [Rhodobacteraceae bacterium]|nr:DUF4864 domain-containing protein [Paracoccaceae bacterium]
MRSLILSFLLTLGLTATAPAQDQDIQATITAQLEAFRADDFARAFTYASPNIRHIFRTPENFGTMVRGGYPMVWRSVEVRYLDLRNMAGYLWQRVVITDAQGAVHVLDYQMIKLESGWKINGVQILDQSMIGA